MSKFDKVMKVAGIVLFIWAILQLAAVWVVGFLYLSGFLK